MLKPPQGTQQSSQQPSSSDVVDRESTGVVQEVEQEISNPSDFKWRTKYQDKKAIIQIWIEAAYLTILLFIIPLMMLMVWNGKVSGILGVMPEYRLGFQNYALAWLGGTLGGTLFAIKWLYHSVARYEWYQDRIIWRLLTPHLSGALSFAIISLIASGLLKIFDQSALADPSTIVGLGFLCGYFSDSAIAKMTEVAHTLFGTLDNKNKYKETK